MIMNILACFPFWENGSWFVAFRFFGMPRRQSTVQVDKVGFSAGRAEEKVVFREGAIDFIKQGLGHKKGAASRAGLHLHRSDLLPGDDLEKPSEADFVPEFRRVFGTGVDAGAATNALIVGVGENS